MRDENDDLKNIKNLNNENKNLNINNINREVNNRINTLSKTSILSFNAQDFSSGDTLFGNNYIKYYLNNKMLSSNTCLHSRPKKMGNLYVFFFINNQPIFSIGNNKLSLVMIYELILQLSFIIMMKTLIKEVLPYMKYMLLCFYLNCFIGHMYIYLINPGIPRIEYYAKTFLKSENYKRMNEEEKKHYYLCEVCNIIVNARDGIEHCVECGICLKNHDHHCYWTGKCIAKNNIWIFHLFSIGTLIYIVWYFIIIIFWLILKIAHFSSLNHNNNP